MSLAVQTLSASTATALEFVRTSGHPDFLDSLPTERFITIVNQLFDLLNSRSLSDSGFKQPICLSTLSKIRSVLSSACTFLLTLETIDGVSVFNTRRMIAIIGFAFCAQSLIGIADLCLAETCTFNKMRYVIAYKFSQDHIELMFNAIRRAGNIMMEY